MDMLEVLLVIQEVAQLLTGGIAGMEPWEVAHIVAIPLHATMVQQVVVITHQVVSIMLEVRGRDPAVILVPVAMHVPRLRVEVYSLVVQ